METSTNLIKLLSPKLINQNLAIVVAESCTGGLLGHLITNQPGASAFFLGGIQAYDNEVKEHLLGVNKQTMINHGAVSEETALEMVSGLFQVFSLAAREKSKKLIAVSITGIAGPQGSENKPPGLVWIGIKTDSIFKASQYNWEGNREENKLASAIQALRLIQSVL